MRTEFEIAVVGAGPAGLAAALAIATTGAEVVLVARPPPQPASDAAADTRTAALFDASIALIRRLGAWPALEAVSAPLAAIRLIDDLGGLLRAPEVVFRASEVGLAAFGWNVPNAALVAALTAELARAGVTVIETTGVTAVTPEAERVTIARADGPAITARLLAAADGRASLGRRAAGIAARTWSYEQSALVLAFAHSRPHKAVSNEFHRAAGPFTTVPLPGDASSLVWVERPAIVARLARLGDAELAGAIEARLGGLLGSVDSLGPRGHFPLTGLSAERFAARRIALVGEAGHVIPPIGAQGLNLGLRDAAALADCVADGRAAGREAGGEETLAAYHASRAGEVAARVGAVDALNRSLISGLWPVTQARGLGLHVLRALPPLRHLAIRLGLEPPGPRPRLMRPQ
jgi:2-octaprenyl-6-methoxyphenol hydroxylase